MRAWIASVVAASCLGAVSFAPSAHANGYDFLFSANRVDNDNEYFLNLAVGNYGYPRRVVQPILPRLRYVEADLPVVLFLARTSGRPIDFIVRLRERGHSWHSIFDRVDVEYDVLFVDIDRDPGPPYGNAWGYWRKNPHRMRLSDRDIRGLVRVQTAHRITRASSWDIARASGRGRPVAVYVAEKKGRSQAYAAGGKFKGGGKQGKPGKGHSKRSH